MKRLIRRSEVCHEIVTETEGRFSLFSAAGRPHLLGRRFFGQRNAPRYPINHPAVSVAGGVRDG